MGQYSRLLVLAALVIACQGCTAVPPAKVVSGVEMTLPLSDSGTGAINAASVTRSRSETSTPLRHGAAPPLEGAVFVGLYSEPPGPAALRAVKMWYDNRTIFRTAGTSESLVEAIQHGTVVWWGQPKSSVRYHAEGDFLVLDYMEAIPPH